jgi:hypothetical protein
MLINIIIDVLIVLFGQFMGSFITVVTEDKILNFRERTEAVLSHITNSIVIFLVLFFTVPIIAHYYMLYLMGKFWFIFIWYGDNMYTRHRKD